MAVPNAFRRFSSLEYFVCVYIYILYVPKCQRMHVYKHIQHGCGALRPLLHSFLGVGFRFRSQISRGSKQNLRSSAEPPHPTWVSMSPTDLGQGFLAPGRKARLPTWIKGTFMERGEVTWWPGPDFKKAWNDEAQLMDAIFIGMIRMELWWWGSKLDVFFSIYI